MFPRQMCAALGMLVGIVLGASCNAVLGVRCVDYCDRTGWREVLWEQQSDEDAPGLARREMVEGACGPVSKSMHDACMSSCETPRESTCAGERQALSRCEAQLGCDEILRSWSDSCQAQFEALSRCDRHHAGPK